jgi:hypothetical protein
MNGQVEQTNRLILQGMKTRMLHDLEARAKNWHKELSSVLWALQINVNIETRGTPFNLVYGADVVLPPKIYLQSARVAHYDSEHEAEARGLDSMLLEERCNTAHINVRKYQESLKKYYNKSVVQWKLSIGDLVLKKDIRIRGTSFHHPRKACSL